MQLVIDALFSPLEPPFQPRKTVGKRVASRDGQKDMSRQVPRKKPANAGYLPPARDVNLPLMLLLVSRLGS